MEFTKDKINNLVNMLNSGPEDQKLGLEIINNSDIRNNIIPLLLIYRKVVQVSTYDWRERCPKFYEDIIQKLNTSGILTYADISKIINKKTPIEHLELFREDIEDFLHSSAKKAGFNFIDKLYVDINIQQYLKDIKYDKDRVSS